jgi:hypothetical protein
MNLEEDKENVANNLPLPTYQTLSRKNSFVEPPVEEKWESNYKLREDKTETSENRHSRPEINYYQAPKPTSYKDQTTKTILKPPKQ